MRRLESGRGTGCRNEATEDGSKPANLCFPDLLQVGPPWCGRKLTDGFAQGREMGSGPGVSGDMAERW